MLEDSDIVVTVENNTMLKDSDIVVTVENNTMLEDSDTMVTQWRIIRCSKKSSWFKRVKELFYRVLLVFRKSITSGRLRGLARLFW